MSRKISGGIALGALLLALLVPAVASADYGSIAINPLTGKYAYAFGYAKKKSAINNAKHRCGQGCRPILWVRNAYGAVVRTTTDPPLYVAGGGTTKNKAFQSARDRLPAGTKSVRYTWVFSGY